jgi:uncharacterized phage protein gp47/JayE
MPLRTLQLSTLEDRGVKRLFETEPSIDASVYGSKVVNIVRACAAAIHPVTLLAGDILNDAFPQTAEGEALDVFAKSEAVVRKPASQSIGAAIIFGNVGDEVPLQTSFDAGGISIETTAPATVAAQSIAIVSTSCLDGVATCTIQTGGIFGRGASVTINTGDTRIDGLREITGAAGVVIKFKITDTNQFNVNGGTVDGAWVNVPVQSIGYGVAQNIANVTAIDGDFEAYLVNGLSGGADAETDSSYSQRIIDSRNLIEGVFTAPQVRLAALKVAGNTRAWVVSPLVNVSGGTPSTAGYKPQPGECCVYIMRDNESNPIASPAILSLTRDSVIEFGAMPCHTVKDDIHVYAPILQSVTFQIANLEPNTQAMKNAVEAELKAYMQDALDFEDSFTDKQQIAVISNARDTGGGRVVDFDLLSNTFNAGSGGLLTFGSVQWS